MESEDACMIAVARRGAAAQFGEDLPGLEGGHGPFADAADAGVGSVDGFLLAGQAGSAVVALSHQRLIMSG